MKRTISMMTKKERLMYLKFPLLLLGTCFFGFGFMGLLAFADQHEFAYVLWGGGAFLFVFAFTDWWAALKAWRNGEACRSGVDGEDYPKD